MTGAAVRVSATLDTRAGLAAQVLSDSPLRCYHTHSARDQVARRPAAGCGGAVGRGVQRSFSLALISRNFREISVQISSGAASAYRKDQGRGGPAAAEETGEGN